MEVKATARLRTGEDYLISSEAVTQSKLRADGTEGIIFRATMHPYTRHSDATYNGKFYFSETELELMLGFLRRKRLERFSKQLSDLHSAVSNLVEGNTAR